MSLNDLVNKLGLMLVEGVQDKAVLKAVFLAGSSGSGKSTVAKKLFGLSGMGLTASGLRLLSSDELYMRALEKKGVSLKDAGKSKYQPLRWAQINKIDKIIKLTGQQRQGVIFDNTGNNYEWYAKIRSRLEKQGYDTMMVFVDVPLETALKRNKARERVVPDSVVKSTWSKVNANKKKYKSLFGKNFVEIDNQDGSGVNKEAMRVVNKFVNRPVQNPKGKKWMKAEMEKLGIEKLGSKGTPFGLEGIGAGLEFDHKAGNPPAVQKLVKPPKKVKPAKPKKDPVEEYLAGVKSIPLKDMLKLVGDPNGAAAIEDMELMLQKYATSEASLSKLKEEGFRNALFGNFMISYLALADAIENGLEEQGKKLWPDVDGAKVSTDMMVTSETGLPSPLPDSFAINGSMSLIFKVLYAPKGLNYDPPPWFDTALLMGLDKATDEFGVTIDIEESRVTPIVTGEDAFTYAIDLKLQFPNSTTLAAAYLDQKPEMAEMIDKIISDKIEDLEKSASPSSSSDYGASSLIKPIELPDVDKYDYDGAMEFLASQNADMPPPQGVEKVRNALIGYMVATVPFFRTLSEKAFNKSSLLKEIYERLVVPVYPSPEFAPDVVGFDVTVKNRTKPTIGTQYKYDIAIRFSTSTGGLFGEESSFSEADAVLMWDEGAKVLEKMLSDMASVSGSKAKANVGFIGDQFVASSVKGDTVTLAYEVDLGSLEKLGKHYSMMSNELGQFTLADVIDDGSGAEAVPKLTSAEIAQFSQVQMPSSLDGNLISAVNNDIETVAKALAAEPNWLETGELSKAAQAQRIVDSVAGWLFCKRELRDLVNKHFSKAKTAEILDAALGGQGIKILSAVIEAEDFNVPTFDSYVKQISGNGLQPIMQGSVTLPLFLTVLTDAWAKGVPNGFENASQSGATVLENLKDILAHVLGPLEGSYSGGKVDTDPVAVSSQDSALDLSGNQFQTKLSVMALDFEYLGSLLTSGLQAQKDFVLKILNKDPVAGFGISPSASPELNPQSAPEFALPDSSVELWEALKKGDIIEVGWGGMALPPKQYVVGTKSSSKGGKGYYSVPYKQIKITPLGEEPKPMKNSAKLRLREGEVLWVTKWDTVKFNPKFKLISKAKKVSKKKQQKQVSPDQTAKFDKIMSVLEGVKKGTKLHILFDNFGENDTYKLKVVRVKGSKYELGHMGPSSAPNLSLNIDEAGKFVTIGLDDSPYNFPVKGIKILK